jgi:hypothetical protein
MKYLLLISVISFKTFSAEIATSSDRVLKINQGCSERELPKKTIILIDQTVDNKNSLISVLEGVEQRVSSIYKSDERDYLLNHRFELARIDDSGEHSAAWSVQTPKELGSKSSHLTNSLFNLKSNIEKSIAEIKNDKKVYSSSLLLEQISNYSKNLGKCDNLLVISDLLLVDSENNFEHGKFTKPMNLDVSNSNISLLRVEKKGMELREIRKVEAWWIESLNGGSKFTSNYSLNSSAIKNTNKPKTLRKKTSPEARSISSINKIEKKDLELTDEVLLPEASVDKAPLIESKSELLFGDTLNFDGQAPVELDYKGVTPKSNCVSDSEAISPTKSGLTIDTSDNVDESDELNYVDIGDFVTLGINITEEDLRETPKKPIVVTPPQVPEKKEVDLKLLQLSCNEFTGRLSREAFPLCNIKIADIKYSKIDLTMNEEGRISSFDNSLNLTETKKMCLSGYVANRPAMSVGADFTCRVLIQ